jgi:structural maintenance of chromosomes protein 5
VNTLLKHHHSLYEAELWGIEAESDLNTLRERNSDIHRLLDERKIEIDRLKRDIETQKALSTTLLNEFKRLHENMSDQDQALVKEWSQREASLDELNAEIEATNGRIELLHAGNPQLLQNYERRQREIDNLETTLNNFDTELATLTDNIRQLRLRWEPELDTLVSEISDAFAHNFEQIGCAGQVGIEKYEEDFAKWAIRIEVKFRYVG